MIAPTRVSFILETSATIRQHPVGRGFEEVHEREGHKPKSVLQYGYAKTPLRGIEKGSALFALPSMGSNIFFQGSFWGVWGTFFKKSPTKTPRLPHTPRSFAVGVAHHVEDLVIVRERGEKLARGGKALLVQVDEGVVQEEEGLFAFGVERVRKG